MSTRLLVAGGVALVWLAAVSAQSGDVARQIPHIARSTPGSPPLQRLAAQTGASAVSPATPRALLDRYCVACHNERLKTADLLLDQLDLTRLGDRAETGELVVRKLRAGLMPPTGMPRPDPATLESLIRWMEDELDRHTPVHLPPPGLRRLNRTEYGNVIRDLLAINVDPTTFLPSDDSTRGFDNIAGALTMSPALMEAYLSAAGKISRLAVGHVDAATQAVYDVPADTAQNHHIEGLPFGTRGGILIDHQFSADGQYAFNVKGITGYFQAVLGTIPDEQLIVTVDGQLVHQFDWDADISRTTGRGAWTPRIAIKAGLRRVGVTFLATNDLPGTELNRPFQRTMNTPGTIPGFVFYPHVGQVTIEGPYDPLGAPDSAARRRIFVCQPATAREEAPCAKTIVSTMARRAYRRPVTDADLEPLMAFYEAGRAEGGRFDDGIEAALQRMLVDPEFIYRREREPAGLAPGDTWRLGDLELASRLSFFLWSSIPDDELIEIAADGRLSDPAVLEPQVRRMLADPRAEALVRNFTGQWLSVRSLATSEPVVELFPDFDDNLRQALQREVELFFASIVQEDRSILELLTADYTFVNERLAKHYGIPNVYGPQFRRVPLGPEVDVRRGLLGKGALLTVTSMPARTSPVMRGKWFQQTLLGVPPPDPPPGVEGIEEKPPDTAGNLRVLSMREMLAQHRANPVCASCHSIFEPVGIALEHFDAVGAWRTHDEGVPIDPSGQLADGTQIGGVADLRAAMVRYGDQFVRVVAEKLLTYALGRGVEYEDMPMVRSIVRESGAHDYRFSSLVMAIVESPAFRMNMKPEPGAERRAAR